MTESIAVSSDDEHAAGGADALAIDAAIAWHASLVGEDAEVFAEFNAW